MNWFKKIKAWFLGEDKNYIPPAPQVDPYPESVQDMIDEGAPFLNKPKVVKGRKKRTAQPPRR